MKTSSKGISWIRSAILWLMTIVALGACGSGSVSISLPVSEGPPLLDQPIVSVNPEFVGARAELEFLLQEDSILRGRFYTPNYPPDGPVTIRSLPQHGLLTLEPRGEIFVYTVDADFWGEDTYEYSTYNGLRVTVRLNIESKNDTPKLSANIARVAGQGSVFVESLQATDADGDALRFSANGLPVWLNLDAATGTLSGLPTQADIGFSDDVTLRVTDVTGLFDEVTGVRFEVIDVNDAPTLNLSQLPHELKARESISARVFPGDPDGDSVEVSVEENAFVTSKVSGDLITLTASDVNGVTHVNIVIKATDQLGKTTREILPLTIYPLTESGRGLTVFGSKEGRGVHMVVLGDGYVVDQQSLFREHVGDVILTMNADSGIAAHLGAFNIHMISTVSVDSGADDNDLVDGRNTAYDSAYNCRSIVRLICANTLAMFESALMEYPAVDQIILLVNDRRYGGSGNSGGSVAITSAYYPEIALHEMGHSLADLADEYVDNLILETTGLLPFEEGRYPNVTALANPDEVPWTHWIDTSMPLPHNPEEPGVGVFEGGLYRFEGVFRSTFDSRMRSFDAPFGPVNSEQWVLRLYTLTEGIRGFSPIVETVELSVGESQEFIVSPLFGSETQSVQWYFNDVLLPESDDVYQLKLTPPGGTHHLTMTLSDISGAIRTSPPHAGIFTWTWTVVVQ